jgi:hypothetical protein
MQDTKTSENSDPYTKKIIPDPQHWREEGSLGLNRVDGGNFRWFR